MIRVVLCAIFIVYFGAKYLLSYLIVFLIYFCLLGIGGLAAL